MRHPYRTDDDWLGRRVSSGDRQAFSVLYERYRDPLYRYCRFLLRSDADANDAVQSTFMRAFEALQRGQRDAPLRPWLFRIAHNEAMSLLRQRKATEAVVDLLQWHARTVEDRSREREDVGSLFADLWLLPESARGALVLRELVGLSHAEIAVTQGTTVSSVKHAIFEARRALMDFAGGRQMDCRQVRQAILEDDRRVLRSRKIRAHLRSCAACDRFAAAGSRQSRSLSAVAPSIWALAVTKLLALKAHVSWSGVPVGSLNTAGIVAVLGSKAGDALMAAKAASVLMAIIAAGTVGVGVTDDAGESGHSADAPSPLTAVSAAAVTSSGPTDVPQATAAFKSPGFAGAMRITPTLRTTVRPVEAASRGPATDRTRSHARQRFGRRAGQSGKGPGGSAQGAALGRPAVAVRSNRGVRPNPSPGGIGRGPADEGAVTHPGVKKGGHGAGGSRGRTVGGGRGRTVGGSRGETAGGSRGETAGGSRGGTATGNARSDKPATGSRGTGNRGGDERGSTRTSGAGAAGGGNRPAPPAAANRTPAGGPSPSAPAGPGPSTGPPGQSQPDSAGHGPPQPDSAGHAPSLTRRAPP